MPRYVVERQVPRGLGAEAGLKAFGAREDDLERDREQGVTWLHSYVSEDRKKTFCVYDGPSPEAIRRTAARNRLPIERITQVRVLDPYVYP
jgi:predicted RNA-binding protein with PIN domain